MTFFPSSDRLPPGTPVSDATFRARFAAQMAANALQYEAVPAVESTVLAAGGLRPAWKPRTGGFL